MAGQGKKFAEKGYTFPKPLIEIQGKPMIEWVVKNLTPAREHRFIFICRREHYEKYKLGATLNLLAPNCKVVISSGDTAGAASTALLAKEYIDNQDPLLLAGSDQFVEGGVNAFLDFAEKENIDGAILTLKATHPKWSFSKIGQSGYVIETAEKNPISDNASVGIFYFKSGSDFAGAAESMIKKDIRTHEQFFIAPAYNELILQDKKIKIFEVPSGLVHSWATPEDLENFLKDPLKAQALK